MALPDNAKLVFKGKIFNIYQWEQKLFDGSYTTFEKAVRSGTVQVITITKENKIVLLREEQPGRSPFISVPGGVMDPGETSEESARRELLEETGMICNELVLWKEQNFGGKMEWPTYYYIAKGCENGFEMKLDPGEKIELYEVDFNQFLEECEKDEFRNKFLSDMIFRIKHTPEKLEEFKNLLFN